MGSLDAFITDKRSPLERMIGESPIPYRRIDFAGAAGRFKGVPLAVRALVGDVHERVSADAAKHLVSVGYLREDLYSEIGEAIFGYEVKVQLLARALGVVTLGGVGEVFEPLVRSADELREHLEPDEVAALFEHFLDYQEERSPLSTARSWEEVEAFLVALKKGLAPATSLNSYDTGSLRFMLREVVARWTMRTKRLSSGTSPASASSPSSST